MSYIKGFTLIELLVVVLIIGILASVALPQYQKAVFKSQATEAFMNLKTMKNALEVCELSNGRVSNTNEYCRYPENLDVTIGNAYENFFETDKFMYIVGRGGAAGLDDSIATSAIMLGNPYDLCICLYDDGHFSTNNQTLGCTNDKYPNFNVAKTLNIAEDEACTCC
ncbi:MAG: prepilin-type N-terminal cleavage/methylation domain-containing protein [Elusimicrobiaceae bacterium]|nr:prepilin-type N-terminal cleavage/methylation domain-containing protein [Elusimicrobiaceae bacterium]